MVKTQILKLRGVLSFCKLKISEKLMCNGGDRVSLRMVITKHLCVCLCACMCALFF